MIARFTLPYPPTLNSYWRHIPDPHRSGQVRHLIGKAGREYRAWVMQWAYTIRPRPLPGPLVLLLDAYPPDARERDGDNLPKCVFDSLVHAGVLSGDSNKVIAAHAVIWHPATRDHKLIVSAVAAEELRDGIVLRHATS